MTLAEMEEAIEEQTPYWLRIIEAKAEAFGSVGDQIRKLGLTDTDSIYKKAIVPLIEEQGCGWVLLEQLLQQFCRDWSEDRVQAVVASVRERQESALAEEQQEWVYLLGRIIISKDSEVAV
jgi:hypothetical protein